MAERIRTQGNRSRALLYLTHVRGRIFYPRVGGRPPVNTTDRSLLGNRGRDWLRCGLPCRLWLSLFRVRGGFVSPCHWLALGFGSVSVVKLVRLFRLSTLLVRVWCWLYSFAFRVCFGRSARAVVAFCSPLGSAHRVGSPVRNLARKYEFRVVRAPCLNIAAYTSREIGRSASPRSRIRRFEVPKTPPLVMRAH